MPDRVKRLVVTLVLAAVVIALYAYLAKIGFISSYLHLTEPDRIP